MKTNRQTLIGAILVLALLAPVVSAQDGQLLRILTFDIKLGHQQEWEAAVKELMGTLTKMGADYPVFAGTSATTIGSYTFAIPISSLAEIDTQTELTGKAVAAHPELFQKLQAAGRGNSSAVIQTRPDLSYTPENPRLADGDGGFARVAWLRPLPGKSQQVEAMIKDFAALNKKEGLRDGFTVYVPVIGRDAPLYTLRTVAKDEVDFYVQNAKNQEKTAEGFQAILQKYGPIMESVEFTTSVTRPDLGRQP